MIREVSRLHVQRQWIAYQRMAGPACVAFSGWSGESRTEAIHVVGDEAKQAGDRQFPKVGGSTLRSSAIGPNRSAVAAVREAL